MISRRVNLYFPIIFIAILSLWFRISYFDQMVIDTPIRGDAIYYVQYAKNLVEFSTFSKEKNSSSPRPDSYWSPGYPGFIAIAIIIGNKLGVNSYRLIMYSQAVLGALTAVLTLLLGRLFLDRYWSIIPSILVSLSPHLISMGGYILTETLFSFLLLLSIYNFSLAFINKSNWLFSISGLFFGLSYLVNPVVFFTPIILVGAAAFLYGRGKNEHIPSRKQILIPCLVVFFVIVGAWTARGLISVPPEQPSSSDRLLANLVIGTHSDFFDIWRKNPRDPENPATKDSRVIKGSFTAFSSLLLERIIENPFQYAKWYLTDKPLLLWEWNIKYGAGDIYVYPIIESLYTKSSIAIATYSIMKSLHYWLLGLSIIGLIFFFKEIITTYKVPIFLYISLIYVSSVYIVTQSEPRYSIPMRPEMYLCAVFILSKIFEYLKSAKIAHSQKLKDYSPMTK